MNTYFLLYRAVPVAFILLSLNFNNNELVKKKYISYFDKFCRIFICQRLLNHIKLEFLTLSTTNIHMKIKQDTAIVWKQIWLPFFLKIVIKTITITNHFFSNWKSSCKYFMPFQLWITGLILNRIFWRIYRILLLHSHRPTHPST